MNAIHIHGGVPLYGEVKVQGCKNAVLPILAATVLIKGTCIIKNCPNISDVTCMMKLLQSVGCTVCWDDKDIVIDAIQIKENRLPKEYVTGMRSSVILMGALLGRTGEATLDYPGGCVIGDRPIDLHIYALKQLGTEITDNRICINAKAAKLNGNRMHLTFPSVGATENAILAAVLAKGITNIYNCAKEPEITALCDFLRCAGAKIIGDGTERIEIEGVLSLKPVVYEVDTDRIVAGTYIFSVMATSGEVVLRNAPISYLTSTILLAKRIGCNIQYIQNDIMVKSQRPLLARPYVETQVYPGFPSDLQSILLVVLSLAEGNSVVKERIFNKRFRVANELNRMGTAIEIRDQDAFVKGNRSLSGRSVVAEDLRGGAALVLAGLCADGDTFVNNYQFIERGYEDICRDYRALGASIRRYCEE